MIVADTNLIAYLFLDGVHTATAEQVFQRDSQWLAPILWRSEFRSVLSIYLRKGLIDLSVASDIIEEAESLVMNGEHTIPSQPLLQLIATSGCSAYDCEFIWLANDLRVPLITSDKKILKEYPDIAQSPEGFIKS